MADDKKKQTSSKQQVVSSKGEVEILEADHSECEQRCAEYEMKYKRALADYQNLERQTRDAQVRFAKLATQGFVEELVEPYDHLTLAAKHLSDKGLNMVVAQFKKVFEQQGLKEISGLNETFDPMRMEVVETREMDKEYGKVIEVMLPGYELNGVVIKPSKVIVSVPKGGKIEEIEKVESN